VIVWESWDTELWQPATAADTFARPRYGRVYQLFRNPDNDHQHKQLSVRWWKGQAKPVPLFSAVTG
jgi:hypothetical protein